MAEIKKEFMGLLASILVALPLLAVWHFLNKGYPGGDEAAYTIVAEVIYRSFNSEGFLSGVHHFYTGHVGKPTLSPQLLVPALFFFSGRILPALVFYSIALQSMLACTVYALSRCFLRRIDSVLVVAIVLNLPWVSFSSRWPNTEAPYFVFCIATWAFLLRSDHFSKRVLTVLAAFFSGLALCVRPAEGLIDIGVPVLLWVAWMFRVGRLSRSALGNWLLLVALGSSGLLGTLIFRDYFGWSEAGNFAALGICLASVVLSWIYYFRKKSQFNSALPLFILIPLTVVATWFGPCMAGLATWIFRATWTKDHADQTQIGFSRLLHILYGNHVGDWGICLFFFALVLGLGKLGDSEALPASIPRLGRIVAAAFIATFVHAALAALSVNFDSRYFIFELMLLIQFGLVVFLRPTRLRLFRRGLALVSLVLMASVQLNDIGLINSERVGRLRTFWGGHGYQNPQSENLGRELFLRLRPSPGFEGTRRVLLYMPSKDGEMSRHLNMLTLGLIAIENGSGVEFHNPPPPLPDWQDWNRAGEAHYDHYLVGPVDNEALLQKIARDGHLSETLVIPYQGKMLRFLWISADSMQNQK